MKVQPHSSNLQLTHKANRSWIGDWGQGIGQERPFSQCHQHISSSSILEALSSRRSDACSSKKIFSWHWEVVWNRILNMNPAITTWLQQGSVATLCRSIRMKYELCYHHSTATAKSARFCGSKCFNLEAYTKWLLVADSDIWMACFNTQPRIKYVAKSNGCKLEKLIQKNSIGAQVMATAELLCPLVIEVMCLVQKEFNTCNNCMFLCLLSLVIQ